MDVELYHWPLRKQRVFAAVAGLLFVPLAIVAAYRLTPPLARLDDAYIALHSARVALSGHDPIFGVPALVGATSPAYVALLTGILAAGVTDGDTALRLANALGIVAFAWSVWYLAGVEKLSLARRVALVIVALGSGVIIPFNLTNGLETGWAIATLTFAIAAACAGQTLSVAVATGLLPFLRPDLAPASAVVLLYAIRGRRRSEQIHAIATAVVVAAPWLVWTRLDTGSWVTQTMRAKQFFYAEGCGPWLEKALTVFRATGFGLSQLFPLSLGLVALTRHRLGRAGLLAVRQPRWVPVTTGCARTRNPSLCHRAVDTMALSRARDRFLTVFIGRRSGASSRRVRRAVPFLASGNRRVFTGNEDDRRMG